MTDEKSGQRVSRRDLFGLGLARIRDRFDEEIPEALAAQARRATGRPGEPAWAAWDVAPPEGSERFTRAAAESLVQACGVERDERVLDWGCGQGEVALAAARRGAQVTAVDFAAGPLERAWDLAEDEGLDIEWLEQDGLDLLLGNSWFDRSLSGFGVIWSHDVLAAVREMFRVTRPGGTVGFTTWSNRGFFGEVLRVSRERDLLPPGPSPSAWGWDGGLREQFGPYAEGLQVETRELDLGWPATTPCGTSSPRRQLPWPGGWPSCRPRTAARWRTRYGR